MVQTGLEFVPGGIGVTKKRKKSEPSAPLEQRSAFGTSTMSAAYDSNALTVKRPGELGSNSPAFDSDIECEQRLADLDNSVTQKEPRAVSSTAAASTPTTERVMDTAETDMDAQGDDESSATVLDPATSERQYYHDAVAGVHREIWRPGDGDGDKNSEYFERPGPPLPLEQRWRFYQLNTGAGPLNEKTNMPPKYVTLDDRAAYEVFKSTIKRAYIARFWPHDFGGPGKIRARRPHRGRAAITTVDEHGATHTPYAEIGVQKEKYYFTGENDYQPVIYRLPASTGVTESSTVTTDEMSKRKATSPIPEEPRDPRKHGHNQYTPKEQLVRYGAPSQAKGRKRYLPRINTFLRRDASPEWAKDRGKVYVGTAEHSRAFPTFTIIQEDGDGVQQSIEPRQNMSLWMDQSDDEDVSMEHVVDGNVDVVKDTSAIPAAIAGSNGDKMSNMEAQSSQRRSSDAGVASEERIDIDQPRRQRLPRQRSFLERMAAEQDVSAQRFNATDDVNYDSGTFASKLESELALAKQTIAEQAKCIARVINELEEAKGSMQGLQEEMAGLRLELANPKRQRS